MSVQNRLEHMTDYLMDIELKLDHMTMTCEDILREFLTRFEKFHVACRWDGFMRQIQKVAIRGVRALTRAYPGEGDIGAYMKVMRYVLCEAVRDFLQSQ